MEFIDLTDHETAIEDVARGGRSPPGGSERKDLGNERGKRD